MRLIDLGGLVYSTDAGRMAGLVRFILGASRPSKSAARHTSELFVAFLQEIVDSQLPRRDIHVICDNVNSHKTELVKQFLSNCGLVARFGQCPCCARASKRLLL